MNTDNLEICKLTRKIAADTLYQTLQEVLNSNRLISEVAFRDLWLNKFREHKEIFPDGWYFPPPHGIAVLFATDNNPERIKFKTLRAKEFWPRDDVFIDRRNGFMVVYCSPVDRKSFTIGDFGLNVYFGKNPKIQDGLKKHLELTRKIFEFANVGKSFAQLNHFAVNIFAKNGFTNDWWISTTDPTGTNFGHTIPGTENPWTESELKTLNGNKVWEEKLKVISQKRIFINSLEKTVIREGMALTIEPRIMLGKNLNFPNVYYFHTIALFKKDGKEQLTDFNPIFKLVGMDYLL